MSSSCRPLAAFVALFALAASSPVTAASCAARDASDCPCPMQHASAGEHCERGAALAAAMSCCRQAAAETLAPSPGGVRTDERLLDAPTQTGQVVDVEMPATATGGPIATAPALALRRSPPDACALLSVFRI